MRTNLHVVISFIFSAFLSFSAQAQTQTYTGGHISYKTLNAATHTYEVTVVLAKECDGTPFPANIPVDFQYLRVLCALPVTLTENISLVNTQEITPKCTGAMTKCNSMVNPLAGNTKAVYRGVVNISSLLGFLLPCPSSYLRISYSAPSPARIGGAVTSHNLAVPSQPFYIDAYIEDWSVMNESPTFANEPIIRTCNQNITLVDYAQGVEDAEGDSLHFSLVDARRTNGTPVSYNLPRTGLDPLPNPVNINPVTGQITFNPYSLSGDYEGVICILVEEYRGGIEIGEVVREVYVFIENSCGNPPPTVSGINGSATNYEITVCANTPHTFTFDLADAAGPGPISLYVSNNILTKGAVQSRPGTALAQIDWTPTNAHVGKNSFVIVAEDGTCPIKGINSYTYNINVLPAPKGNISTKQDVACLGGTTGSAAKVPVGGIGPYSYNWSNGGSLNNITNLAAGKYYLTTTAVNGCSIFDSVSIYQPQIPGAIDSMAHILPTAISIGWWANSVCAFDNGVYAVEHRNNEVNQWGNFNVPAPPHPIIGIEVLVDATDNNDSTGVLVGFSTDGGISYGGTIYSKIWKYGDPSTGTDSVHIFGSSSDMWGRAAWTATDLTNANFRLCLQKIGRDNDSIHIDQIKLVFHYAEPVTLALNPVVGTQPDTIILTGGTPADGYFTSTSTPLATNEDSLFTISANAGNNNIYYNVVDIKNCLTTTATAQQFSVSPPPPPCNIVTNGPDVCSNDSLFLRETSTGPLAWSWDGPNGYVNGDVEDTIVMPSTLASGIYNVTITDTVSGMMSTCSANIKVYDPYGAESNTGVNDPSYHLAYIGSGFSNPLNAEVSDNNYTNAATGTGHWYGTFDIPTIPATAVIRGIEVLVEGSSGGGTLALEVSPHSGGVTGNFTTSGKSKSWSATGGDTVHIYGGCNDLWDNNITWSPSEFRNLFKVQLVTTAGSIQIDQILVRVHYSMPVTWNQNPTDDIVTNSTLLLSGAAPGGGTFQGPGVTGTNFDASVAGLGIHEVTYGFTDCNGCFGGVDFDMKVAAITCGISTKDSVCIGEPIILVESNDANTVSWDWEDPSTATYSIGDSLIIPSAILSDGGTYTVTVTDLIGNTNVCSTDVVVNAPSGATGNTGWQNPTGNGTGTTWVNYGDPADAYTSNNTYISVPVSAGFHEYIFFSVLNVPPAATVTGIEVRIEGQTPDPNTGLFVAVYSAALSTPFNFGSYTQSWSAGGTDSIYVYGGCNDLWGVAPGNWNSTNFNGAFKIRLIPQGNSTNYIDIDDIEVIVHYSELISLVLIPNTDVVSNNTRALTEGLPTGGIYTGLGVTGTNFDASSAGVGTHAIGYEFADCNGCVTAATDVMTVAPPPLPCNAVAAVDTLCVGEDLFLNEVGGATGTITWSWSGPGGLSNANTQTPSIIGVGVGDGGTYTVTVSDGTFNAPCLVDIVVQEPYGLEVTAPTVNPNFNSGFWNTMSNVYSSNDNYMDDYGGTGINVQLGFNPLSLPAGAVIRGIEIEVEGYAPNSGTGVAIEVKPASSTFYSSTGANIIWPASASDNTFTYGGCNDLWGMTWDASTDFGTAFRVGVTSTGPFGNYMYVDNIRLIVHYSMPVTWNQNPTDDIVTNSILLLSGAAPGGGTFQGPGVTGTNFDASTAGLGIHEVTYGFTDCNGCFGGATEIMTVNPPPLPCDAIAAEDTLCVGEDLFLNEIGNNANDWTWTGPTSATFSNPNIQNPTVSNIQLSDAGTYSVSITDGGGTSNTCAVDVVVVAPSGATSNTGFNSPSTNSPPFGGWVAYAPANAYASDNVYTAPSGSGLTHQYGGFNISAIPVGADITGVEVRIEGRTANPDVDLAVEILPALIPSGIVYTQDIAVAGTDSVYVYGGCNDLWGQSPLFLTAGDFTGLFQVRVSTVGPNVTPVAIDHIQVIVHYKEPITFELPYDEASISSIVLLNSGTVYPAGGVFSSVTLGVSKDTAYINGATAEIKHGITYGFEDCNGCFDATNVATDSINVVGISCFGVGALPVCSGPGGQLDLSGEYNGVQSIIQSEWIGPNGFYQLQTGIAANFNVSISNPIDSIYTYVITTGTGTDTCRVANVVKKAYSYTSSDTVTGLFLSTLGGFVNANDVVNSDNIYAAAAVNGTQTTWSVFNPSTPTIPAAATITGVEILIEGHAPLQSTGLAVAISNQTNAVAPFAPTIHTNVFNAFNTTDAILSFGGLNDLWGEDITYWTPAQFNANDFKIRLTKIGADGDSVKIDNISLVVHYSEPTTFTLPVGTVSIPDTILLESYGTLSPLGGIFTSTTVGAMGGLDTFFTAIAGAGTHDITYGFLDGNGCVGGATAQLSVAAAAPLTCIAELEYDTICFGEDVNAAVLPFDGTGPYTYSWVTSAGTFSNATAQFPVLMGVPPGNYTVTVTVMDALLATTTCTHALTVLPNPTPDIGAVDDSVCVGENIRLNTTTIGGDYIYDWSGPNGFISYELNPIIYTAAIPDSGTYTLFVTDTVTGCVSKDTSIFIMVHKRPERANLSSTAPFCEGDNIVLTADTVELDMKWTFNSSTDTIITGYQYDLTILPTSSFYQTGFWELTMIDTNGCQSTSNPIIAIINPGPPTPFINAPDTVCFGEDVRFGVPASSNTTYSWYRDSLLNDPIVQNTTIPFVDVLNVTTDTTIYLVITNTNNGCTSPIGAALVAVIPELVAPDVSDSIVICEGEDFDIEIFTSGDSYEWTYPDLITTNLNPNFTITNAQFPDDEGNYILRMEDEYGCKFPDTFVYVKVNPTPNFNPIITDTICEGDALLLSMLGSADSVNWFLPNGNLFTADHDTAIFALSGTTEYQGGIWGAVSIDTMTGCASDTSYVEAVIMTPPPSTGIFSNMPVCSGDSIHVWTNPDPNLLYFWYKPDSTEIALGVDSISLHYDSIATYSAVVMVVQDAGRYCATVDSILIDTFITQPAPDIIPDTTICEGESFTISTNTIASEYNWDLDGFPLLYSTASFTIPNFMATDTGLYTLDAFDLNGCAMPPASVHVKINLLTNTTLSAPKNPLCITDTLRINSSGPCDSVQWIKPDGSILLGFSGANLVIPPGHPDHQDGIWSTICFDSSCTTPSASIDIQIGTLPISTGISSNMPICIGDVLSLTTTAQTGLQYEWRDQDFNIITLGNTLSVSNLIDTVIYLGITNPLTGCFTVDSIATVVSPNPPVPTVVGTTTVCFGDSIIMGTPTIASSYQWTGQSGFSSNDSAFVITPASGANDGPYTISITNAAGCTSDTMVFVNVLNPPPFPMVNTNTPLCSRDTLVLSSVPGGWINAFWVTPNGDTLVESSIPLIIAPDSSDFVSGIWRVIHVYPPGCTSIIDTNIVIYPRPTATITSNGPICEGGSVTINVPVIPNVTQYNWFTQPLTRVDSVQNPTFTNITTDTTFYLVVNDIYGCETFVDSINVDTFQWSGPSQLLADTIHACSDGSQVIFNLVQSPNTIYDWIEPNPNPFVTDTVPFINALASNNGMYYVTATDTLTGCQKVDSTFLSVTPNISSSDIIVLQKQCEGEDIILQFSNTSLPSHLIYEWVFFSGSTAIDTLFGASTELIVRSDSSYYSAIAGTDFVILQIRDTITGCIGSGPNVNIEQYPLPTFPIVSNSGPVCSGDSLQLIVNNLQGGNTYEWAADSAFSIPLTGTIPWVQNITTDSTFYLRVTSVNGCTVDTFMAVQVIAPDTAQLPADISVCEGDSIFMYTTSSASSYNWTLNGNYVSNDSAFVITSALASLHSGDYILSMVDANGCAMPDDTLNVSVGTITNSVGVLGSRDVCQGETISLTSFTFPPLSNIIWVNTTNDTIVNTTLLLDSTNVLYGPDTWTMIATNAAGCSQETIVNVTIKPNTIAAVSILTDTAVCMGETASFVGSFHLFGSYVWYGDSLLTDTVSTTRVFSIPNLTTDTTLYFVATSFGGCPSNPIGAAVIVNPTPPQPNIIADTSVCEGETLQLTTTDTLGIINYRWRGPFGFISNQQNPTLNTVNFRDAGIYTLVVTDSNRCASDTSFVNVSIDSLPAAPTTQLITLLCERDTIFLVADSSAHCGATEWVGPPGTTLLQGDSVAIPFGDSNYVSGIWQMHCIDTITNCESVSNINIVIVLPAPDTQATTVVNPVCLGGAVTLTTATVNANTAFTWYADSTSAVIAATGQTPTIPGIDQDTVFYLVITDGAGCTSLPIATPVLPVTLSPPNIPADFAVCEGDSIRVSYQGAMGASYQWTGPNGFSTYDSTFVITPATLANDSLYTFSMVDSNGCVLGDTSLYITVNPLPAIPVATWDSIMCSTDTLNLLSNILPNIVSTWNVPNGNTLFGDTLTILPDSVDYVSGVWQLTHTNSLTGCSATIDTNIVIHPYPQSGGITDNGPICQGQDIRLTTPTIANIAAYNWYVLPIQQVDSVQNPTITNITTDSTFYLVVTDIWGCTYAVDSIEIQPNSASITLPILTGLDSVLQCDGTSLSLFASNTQGASYQWTGPNNFVANGQNPTKTLTVSDTGWYFVEVIDSNGCRLSDSLYAQVEIVPQATYTVTTPCYGDAIEFTYNGTVCPTCTYQWLHTFGIYDSTTTSPILVIDATNPLYDTLGVAGNMILELKDTTLTCTSITILPYTINPLPPAPNAANSGSVCSGDSVQLIVNNLQSGATYQWYADSSLSTAIGNGPVVWAQNITTASTFYVEVTSVDGCLADTFTTVQIALPSAITNVNYTSIVCAGDSIKVNATDAGTSHHWVGPNGFSTNDSAFVITPATTANDGTYTLSMIDINGCPMLDTTIFITVYGLPPTPAIIGDSTVCAGDSIVLTMTASCDSLVWFNTAGLFVTTDTLGLLEAAPYVDNWQVVCYNTSTGCSSTSAPHSVAVVGPPTTLVSNNGPLCGIGTAEFRVDNIIQGATYTWYNADTTSMISAAGSTILQIPNVGNDTAIVLQTNLNGCVAYAVDTVFLTSAISPILLAINTPCEGDSVVIGTTSYGANYSWSGPNGFVTYDSSFVLTNVSHSSVGTYTLSFIDKNGCRAADTSITLGFNPSPAIPSITGNTTICEGDTLFLGANVSTTCAKIEWVSSSNAVAGSLTSLTIDKGNPNYQSTTWTLICQDGLGCTSDTTVPITRVTAPVVVATNNGPICVGDDAVFTAAGGNASLSYTWYDNNGNQLGVGQTLTLPAINAGIGVVLEARDSSGCEGQDTDSIITTQGGASPIANYDTIRIVAGASSTIINVVANDSLTSTWNIGVNQTLDLGTLVNLNNGSFDLDFTGVTQDDQFIYELCSPACGTVCDTAIVYIDIQELSGCDIPNIFTPNGDNVNDVFEIPCLSGMGTKLWIFNRWGDLIYQTDNYQNNWDGTFNGVNVPDGTYFFILQNSSGEEIQSSIEVRR